jgi:hypothetical protein
MFVAEVSLQWIVYNGRAVKAPSTGLTIGFILRVLHHPITGKKREAGCEGGIYQGTTIIIIVGFCVIDTMG